MILACSGVAWSQSVQGVITGTITDPTGAVVPGATVTITNAGTNISQSTTTGSDGSYRFSLVPPGTYTLEIKAANFAGVRASGIVVEASQDDDTRSSDRKSTRLNPVTPISRMPSSA